MKASDFRTGFENANGRLVELGEGVVRFEAEARQSPRPLWFHFELRLVPASEVRFELVNAGACLGGLHSFAPVRPVYSYDRKTWRRFRGAGVDEQAAVFWFEGRLARGPVRIAMSYPYTYADLQRWLRTLRGEPGVTVRSACRTAGGREVPVVTLEPPGGGRERFGVWIAARQHAGEAPGSYSLEGLVAFLLGRAPEARWLRRYVALNLVPMVDVDGVHAGDYGKDAAPVDFNRDWVEQPQRPTIRALRDLVDDWARKHPFDLGLDSHAPTAGEPSYAFLIPRHLTDEAFRKREARFIGLLAEQAPRDCPFSAELCRCLNQDSGPTETFDACQRLRHGAFTICLEHSYHRTGSGHYVTPERLRRFGRSVGRALAGYFRVEAGERT